MRKGCAAATGGGSIVIKASSLHVNREVAALRLTDGLRSKQMMMFGQDIRTDK